MKGTVGTIDLVLYSQKIFQTTIDCSKHGCVTVRVGKHRI